MKTIRFISSVFCIGNIPYAPGTFASLFALGLFWLLPVSNFAMFISLPILAVISVWITNAAYDGIDDKRIVLDELIGMGFAISFFDKTAVYYILGFILFRLFDIFKPLGIKKIEKLKGGWGIVLDDCLAGLYANISLTILVYIFGF